MAQLRCPRCQNVVDVPASGNPVCDRCGFTAPAPAATRAAIPTPAAPAPFQPAPSSMAPVAPPTYAPPAQRAWGKPRSFLLSFFLGIVTLGVYFYVWNFKVFRELDQEHGERHAAAWFWTALALQVLGILLLMFLTTYILLTTAANQEPDLLLVYLVFYPVSLVATAVYLSYIYKEISRLERYRQTRGLSEGLAPVWFLLLYIFGAFIVIPTIVAYYLLQKSINEVWWNVYTQRQIPWPL